MDNWEQYLNQEETIPQDDETYLSEEMLANYISRLSGMQDGTNVAKVELSYQAYDSDIEDDNLNARRIYHISNASARIYRNKAFDDLFLVDIIFKSYDDTELKLMWGRLQQHLRNQSEHADKSWVFYLNMLERASVTLQTHEQDMLLTANIFNPILCYLTRETPNTIVQETLINQELQGGNIIRMLVPTTLLTFSVLDDINTNQIKGEVQRDEDTAKFINNL